MKRCLPGERRAKTSSARSAPDIRHMRIKGPVGEGNEARLRTGRGESSVTQSAPHVVGIKISQLAHGTEHELSIGKLEGKGSSGFAPPGLEGAATLDERGKGRVHRLTKGGKEVEGDPESEGRPVPLIWETVSSLSGSPSTSFPPLVSRCTRPLPARRALPHLPVLGREPGRTLAFEFTDGKLMFSAVRQLADFDADHVRSRLSDGAFATACAEAGLIALTKLVPLSAYDGCLGTPRRGSLRPPSHPASTSSSILSIPLRAIPAISAICLRSSPAWRCTRASASG